MTDETMTVSPVSEGEMSQIQALFKKAADTIVAFSSLSEQVKSLQAQVNDLQATVNRYRNQIDTQDEALYKLRREREELLQEGAKHRQEANDARHDSEALKGSNEMLTGHVNDLSEKLERVRTDRDDAQYKAEELKEKVASLEATLSKFRELAQALMPQPEPVPVTVPQSAVITTFPEAPKPYSYEPAPERQEEHEDHRSDQSVRGW